MKTFYILLFLTAMNCRDAEAQWTRVDKLPHTDFYSLLYHNKTIYAGGINRIYTSKNEGISWDSSAVVANDITSVDDFLLFEGSWFASAYGYGVYKSNNNGASWQNITVGINRYITELHSWKGKLYASTDDGGIYRLNINGEQWEPFNNGFTWSTSTTISSNSTCMVAPGGANGSIFRYTEQTGYWQEHLIKGTIAPGLTVSDIISVNDTLIAATNSGVYSSLDGITWNNTGTIRNGSYVFLANVKQAVFAVVNHGLNEVTIYKKPKTDAANKPWEITDMFHNTGVYDLLVTPQYMWQARLDGIYFRKLTDYNVDPPFEEEDLPFTIGKIYPNPSAQKVQLQIQVKETTTFSISITNTTGQVMAQPYSNATLVKGVNTISVNRALTRGMYYLTVTIGGKKYTRKFIIN